jgi:hypothetical protein
VVTRDDGAAYATGSEESDDISLIRMCMQYGVTRQKRCNAANL